MNRNPLILASRNRILVIGSRCVNKHHYDFKLPQGRHFGNHFSWKWWKSMIKCFHANFSSAWKPLTCWLLKDLLERCFLGSDLTNSLTACSFGNTLDMTMFFSFKMFKIWCRLRKWNKKLRKRFSFLKKLRLNREKEILTVFKRILAIGCQCVNKHP